MANVGSFGSINFFCKSLKNRNKMLSFHDMSRTSRASFAEHERNGKKPLLEFNADELDEITLTIEADARYGIKPLEVEEKLFKKKSAGQAEIFVLGGKQVGENPYVITSIAETYKSLHTDGRPIKIGFQITIKEYANPVIKKSDIKKERQLGAAEMQPRKTSSETYTVVKGDCLWNIAKKIYGSGAQYTKIFNANKDKIKDPNRIYPGQVLIIPK